MRKILSLVLVLSLVLGSFGFAFAAPADVEGTDYEDAVTRLSALDILSGYDDGTFKPEKTITRAEFSKIMANILGVGSAAQYAAGATKFADVPADHWATGYINVVSDMKIVNGYGDGNFGPEDKVTYAQAVTMIVRALGFEPKAQAIGGYPGGYLAIAAEEEITDDVNVVNTLAATRGDVALMVDNSLTVPMMYQKTWGQYPEYANDDEDKTLMKTKLGVDEVSGVVTAIPNTDSTLDPDEIKIDGDKYDVLVEDVNFDSLLGLEVTVWEDGGDILDFDIDTDEDNILFDTMTASTEKEISLYVDDSSYEWADKAKVYVNFEEEKDLDKVPANAFGYVVLNDKEEVTYANLFNFTEVKLGAVYDVEDDVYKYVDTAAQKDELELSDYPDGIFVYNEKMQLVDTDEIKVDSAIFAWETSDELYLVVKNGAVSGTLERIKDAEVKIDDTNYDVADTNGVAYSDDKFDTFAVYNDVADLDDLGDQEVTAVLDLNGEILLIHGDSDATSGTMYGIVTYTELGSTAEATVFTKDGEEVKYEFEDRADAKGYEQGATDIDYFGDFDDNNLGFAVIEFKLNSDGEIDSDNVTLTPMKDADLNTAKEIHKSADKNYFYVDINGTGDTKDEKYYISEDTVFMSALDSDGLLAPAVVSYEDIYESVLTTDDTDNPTATRALVIGTDGKDADFVVFLDKTFEGADDDIFYGVVTDSPWKDGSDYVAKIDVLTEGEDEYVVANKADFTEGDLVAFKYNTDNEIKLASSVTTSGTVTANVYGFDYDDGYLNINNSQEIKVVDGAVVYALDVTLNDDGTLKSIDGIDEEIKLNDIEDYNNLEYVLDEDGMLAAAVVYETGTTTTTSDWKLTLTDDAAGITAAITKPSDKAFADYYAAIYEGDTLKEIKTAAASVPFTTGLSTGKIYTVKVLDKDLKVIVEKNIANVN